MAIPFLVLSYPEEVVVLQGKETTGCPDRVKACVCVHVCTDICMWVFGDFHPRGLSVICPIRPRIQLFKLEPDSGLYDDTEIIQTHPTSPPKGLHMF